MRFRDYVSRRKGLLTAFGLILLVNSLTFILWHQNLTAVSNAFFLTLVIVVIAVIHDFYRWRRAILEREEAKETVKRLSDEKSELFMQTKNFSDLLALWSHQMKVPIAAIDLMAQTERLDAAELSAQTFQLNRYLNLLLELERLSDLTTDFRFDKVDVKRLTANAVKDFRPFFIAKGLTVELSGDASWETDARWLKIVLEQLVSNAVKYTDSGGLTIEMDAREIRLTDTGIGILPEDLPRLFEHAYTGFNGRAAQAKSTGLGLYLAGQICEKLGLLLSVESQVGVGSRFTIRNFGKNS